MAASVGGSFPALPTGTRPCPIIRSAAKGGDAVGTDRGDPPADARRHRLDQAEIDQPAHRSFAGDPLQTVTGVNAPGRVGKDVRR